MITIIYELVRVSKYKNVLLKNEKNKIIQF